MKALIVWAHPEENSFTHSLVEMARQTLTQAGWEVRTTDLYRENFEAVASGADFLQRAEPERLVYDDEQRAAARGGGFNAEIEKQLQDVQWCDLLILQFPLWWFSTPAIMKGWIDRIMVKGVAYGGGKWYDRGGFSGRRAMLSLTTAAYSEMCAPRSINGAMDVILWPLQHGVLRFCGFETLAPNIIWSATYIDDAARQAAMADYSHRLVNIAHEKPEPAHGRDDFDNRWQLKPDIEPLTVGQRQSL